MNTKQRSIAFTDEPWTVIRLDDGTVIRVRLNIVSVEQLLGPDDEPVRNPDGQPLFNIRWATATDIQQGTNANVS